MSSPSPLSSKTGDDYGFSECEHTYSAENYIAFSFSFEFTVFSTLASVIWRQFGIKRELESNLANLSTNVFSILFKCSDYSFEFPWRGDSWSCSSEKTNRIFGGGWEWKTLRLTLYSELALRSLKASWMPWQGSDRREYSLVWAFELL